MHGNSDVNADCEASCAGDSESEKQNNNVLKKWAAIKYNGSKDHNKWQQMTSHTVWTGEGRVQSLGGGGYKVASGRALVALHNQVENQPTKKPQNNSRSVQSGARLSWEEAAAAEPAAEAATMRCCRGARMSVGRDKRASDLRRCRRRQPVNKRNC